MFDKYLPSYPFTHMKCTCLIILYYIFFSCTMSNLTHSFSWLSVDTRAWTASCFIQYDYFWWITDQSWLQLDEVRRVRHCLNMGGMTFKFLVLNGFKCCILFLFCKRQHRNYCWILHMHMLLLSRLPMTVKIKHCWWWEVLSVQMCVLIRFSILWNICIVIAWGIFLSCFDCSFQQMVFCFLIFHCKRCLALVWYSLLSQIRVSENCGELCWRMP